MNNFEYFVVSEADSVCLEFSGRMDETMVLPERSQFSGQRLVIDFEEVSFINSLGIRVWMQWLENNPAECIDFRNLPTSITDQVNMVEGFLPASGKVESFYVPFECEECDLETHHHFEEGREFHWGEDNVDPKALYERNCEDCSERLEANIQEKKFFLFLRRSILSSPEKKKTANSSKLAA